jgi:hypothetical protein
MEALTEIISDFFNSIGQTRSFGDVGSMSGLPESGHDWRDGHVHFGGAKRTWRDAPTYAR